MNILFNACVSNLGNNGGTRTILKSAEVLRSLGHNVECLAVVDNFNWFEHKKPINYMPSNVDVVINVAAVDYNVTRQLKVSTKVAWWRAHESWSNSENILRNYYLDPVVKNIVNSVGLQQKLKNEFGAESKVIYQGLDFDWWKNRKLRLKDKIRIGCLHTKQPRKRWKDFVELAGILGIKDYEYVGMGNALSKDRFLTDFKLNANVEELNNLYSSCHIWFAPTDSEGLHNVPMEANLCGCLIVCSDHKLNGMVLDYAFDDTAMIYKFRDIEKAARLIKNPDWSLIDNMKKVIVNKVGSRETNMKKLIKYLTELKNA